MKTPTVSVAICLYNRARFIEETLDSVFAQTFQDYEVVIVDDGSTDGGADLIARRYSDPRLRIISQPHLGLSITRRVSIEESGGEFVAFLDSDDLWVPHKLQQQVTSARARPSVPLFCSDCDYINEQGDVVGRLSDDYKLSDVNLDHDPYGELLKRGCFVWQSTVMARRDALTAIDSYDPQYPYVADYDTWLRLARRFPLHYSPEVLAKWRVHANQFTRSQTEVTLADQRKLLLPLYRTASIPKPIRIAIGDNLLGQHRVASRRLFKDGHVAASAKAAVGMMSLPDRMIAFALGAVAERTTIGPSLLRGYKALRHRWRAVRADRSSTVGPTHIWIDGTVLSATRAGYFTLVAGLIRTLIARPRCVVHVTATEEGERALLEDLGPLSRPLLFHRPTSRRRPRGKAPHPRTIEIVIWRGGFQWADSRRIAIIQDLTTKICPELHTAANVEEFAVFLDYVQHHAHEVVTVSESSRRDIVERLSIFPGSVSVLPMPLHPSYVSPHFDAAVPSIYGVTTPYLFCLGCVEPRKNLRRLVRAFEETGAQGQTLVIAGPAGWDDTFTAFLEESDVGHRVRMLGFVPREHLPSLFHFASVVVYPSVYEGFGLPVLEAMCSSSLVIASNTSSLPEVLGPGITFDPHHSESIAAAILHALSLKPEGAEDYRRQCRVRADAWIERAATTDLFSIAPERMPAPVA